MFQRELGGANCNYCYFALLETFFFFFLQAEVWVQDELRQENIFNNKH